MLAVDIVIFPNQTLLDGNARFGSYLSMNMFARSYPRVIPALSMSHTSTCSSERLRSCSRRNSNDSVWGSHRGSNVLYRVDVEPASSPFHVTKHLGSDLPSRSAYVVDRDNFPPTAINNNGKPESLVRVNGGSVVHRIQFATGKSCYRAEST